MTKNNDFYNLSNLLLFELADSALLLFMAAMHGSTDARVLEGVFLGALGTHTGEGMRRDERPATVALTRGLAARGDRLF